MTARSLQGDRGRRGLGVGAALLAVLIGVGTPPISAKAGGDGDRVVHGRVDTPAGATFDSSQLNTASIHPPPVTAAAGCVTSAAGVDGTGWVVDDVQPGRVFELTADAGSWNDDFDIAFFAAPPGPCEGATPPTPLTYQNHSGDERSVVPEGAELAVVTLVKGSPGAAFTYRELGDAKVRFRQPGRHKPTVVAVIEPRASTTFPENGYGPYHLDYAADHHPWNTDADLENNMDFAADPAGYLPGYPGAEPVQLTLPATGADDVAKLAVADKSKWDGMARSSLEPPRLYRFPGTKVVGAIRFGARSGSVLGMAGPNHTNEAHANKTASVAVGNFHGTCPECAVVFVLFDPGYEEKALEWTAAQPWIDVVTNSWGPPGSLGEPTTFSHRVLSQAVATGQTWVWAAANGYDNRFLVPNSTYTSGMHADWTVVVGAILAAEDRQVGSGTPVDVVGPGYRYPSGGGATADGTSLHSGTSNAAPVVAGTLAHATQLGRDLLGDHVPGHDHGVVARGSARPCDGAVATCPLDDGVLDRAEMLATVFGNVLPAPPRPPDSPEPGGATDAATPYTSTGATPTYMAQGHGIVHGRQDAGEFTAEQRRFLDAMRGAVGPFSRPPGEGNWMIADSKCRQRLWGAWAGGYYNGTEPEFDPTVDQPAMAWNAACSLLPNGVLATDLPVDDECYERLGTKVCIL